MEVQADVSASETASAVTCVSEKSNNTQNDNASTRALAGSMYKQVFFILFFAQNLLFALNLIENIVYSKWTHRM